MKERSDCIFTEAPLPGDHAIIPYCYRRLTNNVWTTPAILAQRLRQGRCGEVNHVIIPYCYRILTNNVWTTPVVLAQRP